MPWQTLARDSTDGLSITLNPVTGTPSFVAARIPVAAGHGTRTAEETATTATSFLARYASSFKIRSASDELDPLGVDVDQLGMQHARFRQVYQGIEVHGAQVKVHFSADGREVIAVSNGYVPDVQIPSAVPTISAAQALAAAKRTLPNGVVMRGPELVVYPYSGCACGTGQSYLAWRIDLSDHSIPAHNLYFVNAHTGTIEYFDRVCTLGAIAMPTTARLADVRATSIPPEITASPNRVVYDAQHGVDLPGKQVASEGSPPRDTDARNAYDFVGATFAYYATTHNRNSYDNAGASLRSTVHYGTSYFNAFWTSQSQQMVYGDGFTQKDVTGHELTHAVTERTAGLEYMFESGALNEAISDIFGAMVDRDNWLIGEGLPRNFLRGKSALRDLSNPANPNVLSPQPAHVNDWVQTCSDNQGVHTNSGIINKAYYNIATALSKEQAEKIFYRLLTVYLNPQSSFEDARAGALQAASDLYGTSSPAYVAVRNGFSAVGLDGNWNPPANDCTCSANAVLQDPGEFGDRLQAMDLAVSLYRFRDSVLGAAPIGTRYRHLYEAHTGRIARLLAAHPATLRDAARVLRALAPALGRLADGAAPHDVITAEVYAQTSAFLDQLVAHDEATGDGSLARTIRMERARLDWTKVVGMTYGQAWEYVQTAQGQRTIFLPSVH
jgi:Zn-dependent metalloprotease